MLAHLNDIIIPIFLLSYYRERGRFGHNTHAQMRISTDL